MSRTSKGSISEIAEWREIITKPILDLIIPKNPITFDYS